MGNWDRSKSTISKPTEDLYRAHQGLMQLTSGSPSHLSAYATNYLEDSLATLLENAGDVLSDFAEEHKNKRSIAFNAISSWLNSCGELESSATYLTKIAGSLQNSVSAVTDGHLALQATNTQHTYYAEEFSDLLQETVSLFNEHYHDFYEKTSNFAGGQCDDVQDALQTRVRDQQIFLHRLGAALFPQEGSRPISDDSLSEKLYKAAEVEIDRVAAATQQLLSIVASTQHVVRTVLAHANTVLTTGESLYAIVQSTLAELLGIERARKEHEYNERQKMINAKVVNATSAQHDEDEKSGKIKVGSKYDNEQNVDFRGGSIPVVTIYYSDKGVEERTISLSAPTPHPPGDAKADEIKYAIFSDGTLLAGEWGYVVLDGPKLVVFDTMEGVLRYPDGKEITFKRDSEDAIKESQIEWQDKGAQILFAHHSSPAQGQPVIAAGTLVAEAGLITKLTNVSGHYTPTFSKVAGAADSLWKAGLISVSTRIVTIGGDVDDVRKKSSTTDAAELQKLAKKMPQVTDGRKEVPYSQVHQAGSSLTTNAAALEVQQQLKQQLSERKKAEISDVKDDEFGENESLYTSALKVRSEIAKKLGEGAPFTHIERKLLQLDPALLESALQSKLEVGLVAAFAEARLSELYPKL